MIVRAPRPASHFTVVTNALIRDERLSWKARGLLIFVLSMPDNWRTTSAHLARVGPDGRDSVRAGLAELEAAGYLTRHRVRKADGTFEHQVTVYDNPQRAGDNSVSSPQPETGKPAPVMPALQEGPTKKNLLGQSLRTDYRAEPRVCGRCAGSGRRVDNGTGTITTCPICGGGGIR